MLSLARPGGNDLDGALSDITIGRADVRSLGMSGPKIRRDLRFARPLIEAANL